MQNIKSARARVSVTVQPFQGKADDAPQRGVNLLCFLLFFWGGWNLLPTVVCTLADGYVFVAAAGGGSSTASTARSSSGSIGIGGSVPMDSDNPPGKSKKSSTTSKPSSSREQGPKGLQSETEGVKSRWSASGAGGDTINRIRSDRSRHKAYDISANFLDQKCFFLWYAGRGEVYSLKYSVPLGVLCGGTKARKMPGVSSTQHPYQVTTAALAILLFSVLANLECYFFVEGQVAMHSCTVFLLFVTLECGTDASFFKMMQIWGKSGRNL